MKECVQCGERYSDDATFCSKDASSLVAVSGTGLIGVVIDGRWRIESKLGEGGMGAVYLGRQTNIDRRVAIKTLRPELTSSPEFISRFEAEARAAGRISNPHCVTVFESGRADALSGMLYLVMEFLDGEVLADRLQRAPLQIDEALQVGIQIASGLAAAHEQGIIHRDLKPENVFLVNVPGDELHAKVLDFGIAKTLDGDSKMTKSGMIMGTPQYMSPEQCHGKVVDVRSDVYSLGTMLYEMLSGRTPFNSPTPITVLFEVVNSPPPRLSELGIVVPNDVEDYVMLMLSKSPEDRPSTAMEVRRSLEKLLSVVRDVERSQNLAVASGPTLAVSPPTPIAIEAVTTPAEKPDSSMKVLVGIAGVLVLALFGTIAFLVWFLPGDSPTEKQVVAVAEPPSESEEVEEAAEEPPENLELSKNLLVAGTELAMALRVAQFEANNHEQPVVKSTPKKRLAAQKAVEKVEEVEKVETEEPAVIARPTVTPKTKIEPRPKPVADKTKPVADKTEKKDSLKERQNRLEQRYRKTVEQAEKLEEKAKELEKLRPW